MIGFIDIFHTHHSELKEVTVLSVTPALYKLQQRPLSVSNLLASPFVSWLQMYNRLTATTAYMRYSFHSLIYFLSFILNYFRLPFQETQVKVKVTLRLTVSQSVSKCWRRAPSGPHDQICITRWQLRSCFCGAPSLTRGRGCWPSPA
jgi:hypothetical protein